MNTVVFLRRPDVPGFWPSIGVVGTILTPIAVLLADGLPLEPLSSLEPTTAAMAARPGSSASASTATGYRRRQFGCSSIVPGRFCCSTTPSASSSWTASSSEPAPAEKGMNRDHGRVVGLRRRRGRVETRRACPSSTSRRPSAPRSAARAASAAVRSFVVVRPRRCHSSMSRPDHQPLRVGVSWVPAEARLARR